MTKLPACPRCGYLLINGVCPIHDGRQVSDRLPIPAPLPVGRDEAERQTAKMLRFAKPRRRSA